MAGPRRDRVTAVRGAWMHAASWLVISFFTLSRSIGKIFCTNASSCCLNSSAGYLASTCAAHSCCQVLGRCLETSIYEASLLAGMTAWPR